MAHRVARVKVSVALDHGHLGNTRVVVKTAFSRPSAS